MPKKRAVEIRINEKEDELDRLKLEKSIKELKEKVNARSRPRTRTTRKR